MDSQISRHRSCGRQAAGRDHRWRDMRPGRKRRPGFRRASGGPFRRQDRRARLFRLRPAVRGRRGSARTAAARTQGAIAAISLGRRRRCPPSFRRAFRDRRRGGPALGLPAVARRHRVEARRRALRLRPNGDMGEVEVPCRARGRHRCLCHNQWQVPVASRWRQSRRQLRLCRARRNGLRRRQGQGPCCRS